MKIRVLLISTIVLAQTSCLPTSQPSSSSYTVMSIADPGGEVSAAGTEIKLLLGNRWTVRTAFEDIFGKTTLVGAKTVEQIVKELVLDQPPGWGGPCDPYANGPQVPYIGSYGYVTIPADIREKGCAESSHSKSAMIPSGSTSRFAWTIRVCDRISNSDAAVRYAATQAGYPTASSLSSPPSDEMIREIYGLFYFGVEPPAEVLDALKDLSDEATQKYSGLEAWRFVIFTVCSSPGWQIF